MKDKYRSYSQQLRIFLVIILAVCLIIPSTPNIAQGSQNPSLEEIAKIFEKVAREKQVPAEILKAIAFAESGWRQWDSSGKVVTNYAGSPPYLGIMQVGAYDPGDIDTVNKLKNDIAFNIAYGADVLLSKWDMTPKIGDGDKSKLENWYFAIWAYNTWSTRNNPNNAAAAGRVAYQDKILKLINTEYYEGVVTPVSITPVPKSLLPAGTLPSKNTSWKTPEPIHYAGFASGMPALSPGEEKELLASVPRLAGIDRIETAVKIARQGWPDGCETVVIARAEDFPDALAGVALAKQNKAPILLTPQNFLDQRVKEALLRLKPLKVIILGGYQAVSQDVEHDLRGILSWTEKIERIAGSDRFETAALIAERFPLDQGVALTTGFDFPDALSLASASAAQGCPLLLVGNDYLPQSTARVLQTLAPRSLYIAGGENAVSSGLLNNLKEATGLTDDQIKRFAGEDRYATSTQILKSFFPGVQKIYLATGQAFPDALAGAALAANSNTPMLLVPLDGPLSGSSTENYLKTLTGSVELQVFGGQNAISDQGIIKIAYLLKP